eukprot:472570_1
MAQLPDDHELNDASHDTENDIKNTFQCSYCHNRHDITDVFLWSTCHHQYSRGCVLFTIRQQLYDKKLPLCGYPNCNALLLEDAAQLVLPHEILIGFYNIHNEHQSILDQDEKQSQSHYRSPDPNHHMDSSSDGITNLSTPILGTIDPDPVDDSSEAEISYNYDRNEQQPLLKNIPYGGYGASNMDSKRSRLFDCVLCNEQHIDEERFEWTECKHLYGRECAENMIISRLFEQDIAPCVKCKKLLNVMDAMTLLPVDEMELFKEYYALKASMETYNADQDTNDTNDNDNAVVEVADQMEKMSIQKEATEHKIDNEKLMPSVLVLPDNNYGALIPMDDDFVDGNGLVLNHQKEAELTKNNLFYCSQCKKVSKLEGKFMSLKCQHVSCKSCAKQHTKHHIEMLQVIPTCPVCPQSITDMDMIAIWGAYEAKQWIDKLFKEKSLKIPPYNHAQPAAAVAAAPALTTAGVPDVQAEEDINDRDANEQADIEHKQEDDKWRHCLTPSCHKKGYLSMEKGEEMRLDCFGCGVAWCVQCCVSWHLGQTCEQYQTDMSMGVDIANNDMAMYYALQEQSQMQFDNNYDDIFNYKEQGFKTCPVCMSVVDKDGGCNYVTCNCGTQFCWVCDAILDESNLAQHYDDGNCPLNDDP